MATRILSESVSELLVHKGYPKINLRQCRSEESIKSFTTALAYAVDNNKFGPYVDKQTPEELLESDAIVFLSQDEMAGVAVWPGGNIGAVFKNNQAPYGSALGELILTALSVGGNKLDCYDGGLSFLYSAFGFIPVAKVKFNRENAPDNWKDGFGEPDIIFWIHCGDSVETVAQRLGTYPRYPKQYPPEYCEGLKYFDGPDAYKDAWKYRDSMIREGPKIFRQLFH